MINAGNNDKTLTADNLQIYLSDILTSINIANQAIGVNARGLPGLIETVKLEARQNDTEDDLKEVGAVLAKVITDLVEALDGIVDDLRFLPLIVSRETYASEPRAHSSNPSMSGSTPSSSGSR